MIGWLGGGCRKRANAKGAKEARAAAAEKRMRKMKGEPTTSDEEVDELASTDDDDGTEEEGEFVEVEEEYGSSDGTDTAKGKGKGKGNGAKEAGGGEKLGDELRDVLERYGFKTVAGPSKPARPDVPKKKKEAQVVEISDEEESDGDKTVSEDEDELPPADPVPSTSSVKNGSRNGTKTTERGGGRAEGEWECRVCLTQVRSPSSRSTEKSQR